MSLLVKALVHVAELTAPDLVLEHVVVDYFWHYIRGG